MIANIIQFIRRIMGRENIEDYGNFPSYADVSNTPAQKIPKNIKQNLDQKITKNNLSTIENKQNKEERINKATLMRQIKTNIFFLDQLLDVLEGQARYLTYYRKVRDLKIQSEGCFKIAHRIKDEAPYYQSTLKMVLKHTRTIAQLLDVK